MSADKPSYQQASQLTADDLRTVAKKISAQQLSRLSLPELDAVVDLISKVVPAGNVPGMILSGLARLPGRRIPAQKMQQDVNALFSGVEQILDKAVYRTFFAGPAAIISGYQNLLKLAGKDPSSAFPEGVWQFYAGYALREDTARHTNETHGFDTLLDQYKIRLSPADRLTAWAMASINCLHQYNALLENEWRERVSLTLLQEAFGSVAAKAQRYSRLYREWEIQRPYRREEDGAKYDYPAYRKLKFEQFLNKSLLTLPAATYETWMDKLKAATQQDLQAYQKQMSILAYLEPGPYGETRVPFDIKDAQIGVIHRDSYYLLPACEQGASQPLNVLTVRAQMAALLETSASQPSQISALTRIKRSALANLRNKLNPTLVSDLDILRYAPIILSADQRARALPLSELRQTERGVGSHALTIFDTGETFVFDQSHIFFDGAWGTALAEIMTNEALSWAHYLSLLPSPAPAPTRLYTSLVLPLQPTDADLIAQAPQILPEVNAETDKVKLKPCLELRKHFKQRNEQIQLTINDLLVLYRAFHAAKYRPSKKLSDEVGKLAQTNPEVAANIRQLVEETSRTNPSILIPMDASQKNPRERVYPLNLEVPVVDLNLIALHAQTVQLLDAYEKSKEDRAVMFNAFQQYQKVYLASLAGFGAFLARAKAVAIQGESSSVGAIKLLAHLPAAIQSLLDKIPEKFDLLNSILKGREVFSNVGAVTQNSTLTRFSTAKDDNAQKQLAWGVITDAQGVMRISLRDFRPQVTSLLNIGRKDLAALIAQDYLEGYAEDFNAFIKDLSRVTLASRESLPPSHTRKRSA
ncbi:MAG: choline/carnitine O-acyltransferase [Anaerolineales bacterium]|nr:choline/carnitine O-acyltransferase [Anaerolineales bacterium]